jgi:tetratricopeptide (TPR) repeat protein
MLLATILSGNNSPIIVPAIQSVVDWVDGIVLVDTGITDDSITLAQEIVGSKLKVVTYPWKNDFAAARNFSLQTAAEQGATWAVTIDTDERLHFPGFKNAAKLLQTLNSNPNTLTWMIPYNQHGYAKERFIRIPAAKLHWAGRTHEALMGAAGHERAILHGCYFTELNKTADQFRYKLERDLAILLEETRDKPTNARWWYYLGQTYDGLKQFAEASTAFERCARLDGWDEEAAWSCFKGAQCHNHLQRFKQGLELCTYGLSRRPDFPELAWLAGYCCYRLGHFRKAITWENMAIHMGHFDGEGIGKERVSFRYLPGWYEGPYDVLRWSYKQLGNEVARQQAEEKYQLATKLREMRSGS